MKLIYWRLETYILINHASYQMQVWGRSWWRWFDLITFWHVSSVQNHCCTENTKYGDIWYKNIKIVGYKNHVFNTPWKYFQQNLCFLCEDKNLVPILLVITHWARLLFSFSIILLFMVSCKLPSPIRFHCPQIYTQFRFMYVCISHLPPQASY